MAGDMESQCTHQICLLAMDSKLDNLLQQSGTTKCINNKLLVAYPTLHEQHKLLKVAIKDLMCKITE
jgi:hypothetical protein